MSNDFASRLRNRAQEVLDFVFKVDGAPGLVSIPRQTSDVDALLCEAADEIERLTKALQGLVDASPALVVKAIRSPEDAAGLEGWNPAMIFARQALSQASGEAA